MDMPKPGKLHQSLGAIAGEWEGDEVLAPSPWGPGGNARGRAVSRIAVDGMALVTDYEETKDGKVVFRGHGVMQPDPSGDEILWWWFDSMGFPPQPPARGRWDGDVLRFEKSTPHGDARYTYRVAADTYDFRIENRFAGAADFSEVMRGTYRRVS